MNEQEWCPQHGYPLPCDKCGYQGEKPQQQSVPTEGLLTIQEVESAWSKSRWGSDIPNFEELTSILNSELAKVSASFSAQLAEALKTQKAHILAEVDKAGLTDEALHKIHNCDDVCESECNLCSGCTLIKQVAGFQLEAIKKVLK